MHDVYYIVYVAHSVQNIQRIHEHTYIGYDMNVE